MSEYRDKMFHLEVLAPKPIPCPLLMTPGYGLAVGGITAAVSAFGRFSAVARPAKRGINPGRRS